MTLIFRLLPILLICSRGGVQNSALPRPAPVSSLYRQVSKIDVRQISEIYLDGVDFLGGVSVADPQMIRRFMTALLHAPDVEPDLNLFDRLEIRFKQTKDRPKPPLSFSFYAGNDQDDFGPEFQYDLRLLSQYQAEALRQFLIRKRNSINLITFNEGLSVKDPAELHLLETDMMRVDSRVFNYTDTGGRFILIDLNYPGGRKSYMLQFYDPIPFKPSTEHPLPPRLWSYFVKVHTMKLEASPSRIRRKRTDQETEHRSGILP